jgi:hypothetical protein
MLTAESKQAKWQAQQAAASALEQARHFIRSRPVLRKVHSSNASDWFSQARAFSFRRASLSRSNTTNKKAG